MNTFPDSKPLRMTRNLERLLILQNSLLWLYLLVSIGLVTPLMLLYLQTAKDRKAPGIDLTRI